MICLKHTGLHQAHIDAEAKMAEFAGYDMPIQYHLGMVKEHQWVRDQAGMFDVSHMGQVMITGENAAAFLSTITPTDFTKTTLGQAKYTVLTSNDGGIIDDLIITHLAENSFFVVINAGRRAQDMEWIRSHCPDDVSIEEMNDRALVALQGPKAVIALSTVLPNVDADSLKYMTAKRSTLENGAEIIISRTGYTGEDGFELSLPNDTALSFWKELTELVYVEPVGLGARDSLRLEMGYPLYGHDISEETTPIQAALGWVMTKGHEGFIGSHRILAEKEHGPSRKRVGIHLKDKGIVREGANIVTEQGESIGHVTSGGFGPTVNQAIAQGYVDIQHAKRDTAIWIELRGRKLKASVGSLAFWEKL